MSNAQNILITTEDQLETIVRRAMQSLLNEVPQNKAAREFPDLMNIEEAYDFIRERGVRISMGYMYRLASIDDLPVMRIGRSLVLKKDDLIDWAKRRTKDRREIQQEAIGGVVKHARKNVVKK